MNIACVCSSALARAAARSSLRISLSPGGVRPSLFRRGGRATSPLATLDRLGRSAPWTQAGRRRRPTGETGRRRLSEAPPLPPRRARTRIARPAPLEVFVPQPRWDAAGLEEGPGGRGFRPRRGGAGRPLFRTKEHIWVSSLDAVDSSIARPHPGGALSRNASATTAPLHSPTPSRDDVRRPRTRPVRWGPVPLTLPLPRAGGGGRGVPASGLKDLARRSRAGFPPTFSSSETPFVSPPVPLDAMPLRTAVGHPSPSPGRRWHTRRMSRRVRTRGPPRAESETARALPPVCAPDLPSSSPHGASVDSPRRDARTPCAELTPGGGTVPEGGEGHHTPAR